MKKKIIIFCLMVVLILGSLGVFVITTGAQQQMPELNVAYCNLSFQDSVCIKYAVKQGTSDVKILIWTSPEAEYTVGTHDSDADL